MARIYTPICEIAKAMLFLPFNKKYVFYYKLYELLFFLTKTLFNTEERSENIKITHKFLSQK